MAEPKALVASPKAAALATVLVGRAGGGERRRGGDALASAKAHDEASACACVCVCVCVCEHVCRAYFALSVGIACTSGCRAAHASLRGGGAAG